MTTSPAPTPIEIAHLLIDHAISRAQDAHVPIAACANLIAVAIQQERERVQRVKSLLDSALEHGSHAWNQLEQGGRVPHDEGWPPSTDDTIVGSAEYHIAALLGYVKRAYDQIAP